jgi:flagellar basal-body rod protein FlgB
MDAGFSGNVDLLMRLMSASTDRARVIASNIANGNTPGYRRQTLQFERLLGEALQSGSEDLSRIQPRVETDFATPTRPDGNNVTLELELSADRQNRLLYDTYAAILQSHFDLLKASVESGR